MKVNRPLSLKRNPSTYVYCPFWPTVLKYGPWRRSRSPIEGLQKGLWNAVFSVLKRAIGEHHVAFQNSCSWSRQSHRYAEMTFDSPHLSWTARDVGRYCHKVAVDGAAGRSGDSGMTYTRSQWLAGHSHRGRRGITRERPLPSCVTLLHSAITN